MTITSTYSSNPVFSPITTPSDGNFSDQTQVAALSNGGFAVIAEDEEGYTDLGIYDAAGNMVGENTDFHVQDGKIVQLSNGNILVMGKDSSGTLDYRFYAMNGADIGGGILSRLALYSNVSVTATADGGFAAAYEVKISGNTTEIGVDLRNSHGASVFNTTLTNATGIVEENPSIAQLKDGGYAIAWDLKAASGDTAVYYEVLNADGSVRQAAQLLDGSGATNTAPSVTALADGGFSIAYQDNYYAAPSGNLSAQSDVTQATFDATGIISTFAQLESSAGTDSAVASATMSDGLVLTAYTHAFSSTDNDVDYSVYDPVAGQPLTGNLVLGGAGSSLIEDNPSVAALADGKFVVSFTVSLTTPTAAIYQLTRTTAGDNAGDTIVGDDIMDKITTGSGNDTVTGGDGADNSIDTGLGYDTAVFSGARAGYTITRNGHQTTVVRPDGGTDTLSNVEKLHFTDQDIFTPPAVRDLSGDGYSDMLLQKSGAIQVWTMNNDGTLNSSAATSMTPPSGWSVVGTGQFNATVDSYDDLLLQNSSGALAIWEMAGATVSATASLGSVATTLKAVTTGDFNGDGKADILLQDSSSGQITVWLMNGTSATTKTTVGSAIGTAWHAIATGDFNGDGKSDIVLQNDSGLVAIWLMNGAGVASSASLGGTTGSGWTVRGAGDFNGDGKSDLVLENASGSLAIWTMNGAAVTAKTGIGSVASSFLVTGTGDFNGDGKADLVFQSSSGAVAEWLMNGSSILSKLNLGSSAFHMVAGTGG